MYSSPVDKTYSRKLWTGKDPQDNELLKDLPSEKKPDVGRLSNGTHRMISSERNGFNPIFKASRPRVFAPFSTKEWLL
jgi:hypothetical protein